MLLKLCSVQEWSCTTVEENSSLSIDKTRLAPVSSLFHSPTKLATPTPDVVKTRRPGTRSCTRDWEIPATANAFNLHHWLYCSVVDKCSAALRDSSRTQGKSWKLAILCSMLTYVLSSCRAVSIVCRYNAFCGCILLLVRRCICHSPNISNIYVALVGTMFIATNMHAPQ